MNQEEQKAIDLELHKLLQKRAVVTVPHNRVMSNTYVNTIFARPKPDGSHQVICNLKRYNMHVEYQKFKMELLTTMLRMVQPGDFMGKIDLSDAFLSVPIHPKHQKLLTFQWGQQLYQYICMAFGLSSSPHTFTKLMKVLLTQLRKKKVNISAYIGDSFLPERSFNKCERALCETGQMFTHAGFIPNVKKSVLYPTQELELLGCMVNSVLMQVTLSDECVDHVCHLCRQLIDNPSTTV